MENERLTKRVTCQFIGGSRTGGRTREGPREGGREGKERWKDGANETIDMQNQTTWTQVIHWKK